MAQIIYQVCKQCGESFSYERKPKGKARLYCSDNCRKRWANDAFAARRFAKRPTECKECGGPIDQPLVGAPRVFCSDKCKLRFSSRVLRRSLGSVAVQRTAVCPSCGDTFTTTRSNRIYCYEKPWCGQIAYQRRSRSGEPVKQVPHDVTCAGCGKVFVGIHPKAKWCSRSCSSTHWSRAKSRTRVSVAGRENYSDRDIFIRDNWTCHLCGDPIDPTLGRNDPLGATVDHVLALANGGTDDQSNVAAAHRVCNLIKGARVD